MKRLLLMLIATGLIALSTACGGNDDAPGSNNSRSDGGWQLIDAGARDAEADDAGPDDTSPEGDADDGEAGPGPADADEPADDEDTGGDVGDDDASSPARTLADYRRCRSEVDCPVGLGVCVKEVTLNREDADGSRTVPIGEIFEDLGDDEGVCTVVCTENPDACSSLSMNGTAADPVEHTCQLVTVGDAPYPLAAPAFPFDDQLDPDEQADGQPFGAICRPPFELDEAIDDSFCAQCQGSADGSSEDCSTSGSICWSLLDQAPADEGQAGTCLSACSADDDCPLGFACDAGDGEDSYCRPVLDTCTNCQDVDADGFGTGRCGGDRTPVTPHDCDDRNELAYFDPSDSQHAFPATCGQQDFNCNGLADDAEQIGVDAYPVEHCEVCFDDCQGALPNGELGCENQGSASEPAPACIAQCEVDAEGNPLFADCNQDPSDGCEVAIDDPDRLYFRDIDGDGYGDPNDSYFACEPDEVPAGYVSNNDDCDDSASAAHGGDDPPAEICDGLDNDCNGQVDDGIDQVGQSCTDTGHPGVCSTGAWVCQGAAGLVCEPDIAPGTQTEVCDGADNDCDGEVDEDGAQGATAYYQDGDGDGYGAAGTSARMACSRPSGYVTDNSDCDDTNSGANPGRDELCSTDFDDDCDGQLNEDSADDAPTWYRDTDSDGYGNSNSTTQACGEPDGYTDRGGDCDDQRQGVNPGADEVCGDSTDNDCDGKVDDASAEDAQIFYRDADGDTYGDPDDGIRACVKPGDYANNADDCNDDPNNHGEYANPVRVEQCDGIDNDCDGDVDEGCPEYFTERTGSVRTRTRIGPPDQVSAAGPLTEENKTCWGDTAWTRARVYYNPNSYPVERLDFYCSNIVIEEDTSQFPYTHSVGSNEGDWTWGPGETSDDHSTDVFACPDGEAIYKVSVEYGGVLDRVKFHCRDIQMAGSGTNASLMTGTETTSTAYGAAADNSASAECGINEVAVGANVTAGWNHYQMMMPVYPTMFGIELKCQKLEMQTK